MIHVSEVCLSEYPLVFMIAEYLRLFFLIKI